MVRFANNKKILIPCVAGAAATATAIVFFLLVPSLSGSSGAGLTYSSYTDPNNVYRNNFYNLSIVYPPGWKVLDDASINSKNFVVVFVGPLQNNFATNINIETAYMQGMSLEQFAQATEKSLASTYSKNNFTVLDKGHTKINGRDAYFITTTFEAEQPTKSKLVILERDNYAYIITYDAMTTTFDDHIKEFEDSLSTFKFL